MPEHLREWSFVFKIPGARPWSNMPFIYVPTRNETMIVSSLCQAGRFNSLARFAKAALLCTFPHDSACMALIWLPDFITSARSNRVHLVCFHLLIAQLSLLLTCGWQLTDCASCAKERQDHHTINSPTTLLSESYLANLRSQCQSRELIRLDPAPSIAL